MRRFLKCAALAAATCLFGAAHALADTQVTYEDEDQAVFSVHVPDFWTLRVGGDRDIAPDAKAPLRSVARVFGLSPELDHGVWVGLMSPPRFRTLQDAKDYAQSLSGQLAKTTEITATQERRVAGYPAFVIEGNGRREGRAVSFTVALLELPNRRVVVGLTVLESGYDPSALTDVNAILHSVKAR